MLKRLKIVSLLAGLLFAAGAAAWQPPRVEYTADSYFETAQGVMQGKVYYSPGKERREYTESGEKMIMILRHDKKRIWMLMPEEKMYMDMQMTGERGEDLSAWKIQQTRLGDETVNGVRTTKYKIIMVSPKGSKMGGFFWTTSEDILMKMDAIAIDKGSKERMKIELTNLQIGAQEASLFEVPAGYSAGMPGMGGMGGIGGINLPGAGGEKVERQPAPPPGEPQPQPQQGGGGFGLGDVLKILR